MSRMHPVFAAQRARLARELAAGADVALRPAGDRLLPARSVTAVLPLEPRCECCGGYGEIDMQGDRPRDAFTLPDTEPCPKGCRPPAPRTVQGTMHP